MIFKANHLALLPLAMQKPTHFFLSSDLSSKLLISTPFSSGIDAKTVPLRPLPDGEKGSYSLPLMVPPSHYSGLFTSIPPPSPLQTPLPGVRRDPLHSFHVVVVSLDRMRPPPAFPPFPFLKCIKKWVFAIERALSGRKFGFFRPAPSPQARTSLSFSILEMGILASPEAQVGRYSFYVLFF